MRFAHLGPKAPLLTDLGVVVAEVPGREQVEAGLDAGRTLRVRYAPAGGIDREPAHDLGEQGRASLERAVARQLLEQRAALAADRERDVGALGALEPTGMPRSRP